MALAALLLLAAANAWGIVRLYRFAEQYPFARASFDSRLSFSFLMSAEEAGIGARIVEHRGRSVEADFRDYVADADYGAGEYVLERNGERYIQTFVKRFNYEAFSFILLLFIFGDIHLIWGIILAAMRPRFRLSRYYALMSLALGGILLSLGMVCFERFAFPVAAFFGSLLAASFIIAAGGSIRSVTRRAVNGAGIALVPLFTAISIVTASVYGTVAGMTALILLNLICYASFMALLIAASRHKDRILRKGVLLVLFTIIGFLIPAGVLLISLYVPFPVSLNVTASMTLLFPMLAGINLASGNAAARVEVDRIYLLSFLTDLAFANTVGFVAYQMIHLIRAGITPLVALIPGFIALMALLFARRWIHLYIVGDEHVRSDQLIESLRQIALFGAETTDLNYRLARIYIQIFRTLSISQMKVFLSSNMMKSSGARMFSSFVGYFDPESRLARYFRKYWGVIRRESIFSGDAFETVTGGMHGTDSFQLVIPLIVKDRLVGVIFAGGKRDGTDFRGSDVEFLNSAAFMIYQMIENEVMLLDYQDKRSFEDELDRASYMQMRFFPRAIPDGAGMDIAFYTRPYIKLMGDYFDYKRLDDRRTAIIIADVTGHGMPAAMIVSVTSMLFHTLMDERLPLEKFFQELNNFLTTRYQGIELITIFAGIYDSGTRTLNYINAGHCPPVIYRKSERNYLQLEERFNILGVSEYSEYAPSVFRLEKSDFMVLYTDGLTEIYDHVRRELIGTDIFERMPRAVFRTTESVLEAFVEETEHYRQDMIKDDITVAIIKID